MFMPEGIHKYIIRLKIENLSEGNEKEKDKKDEKKTSYKLVLFMHKIYI